MSSLGEALPAEIDRNVELLRDYQGIGPAGQIGASFIKQDIDRAIKAMASGDVTQMLQAYEAMKNNK